MSNDIRGVLKSVVNQDGKEIEIEVDLQLHPHYYGYELEDVEVEIENVAVIGQTNPEKE
jgi:ribosomal protein L31